MSTSRRRFLQGLSFAALASGWSWPLAEAEAATLNSSGARIGPNNLITDVKGLRVGVAHDERIRTGTTVILPDRAAVAAVDVRGGGPATRETDALDEHNLVQTIDAIVLSGGSVYGLAAADGVAAWLGAQNKGFALIPAPGVPVSPIVPAASLYDLADGGDKQWGEQPPYRELGRLAASRASERFELGTQGAGYGATTAVGTIKGGLGSASVIASDGTTVGAIVAVNSLGSPVAAGSNAFWATPYEIGREFGGGGSKALVKLRGQPEDWQLGILAGGRKNTTLACVATDLALTRDELKRVAIMAHDGMARAIRPVHSPFDGDIVFAISTAQREPGPERELAVLRVGALAADTLARAIARGVYAATAWPGSSIKSWASLT